MREPTLPRRRYTWEIALLLVPVVWGATFPIVKCAVERCPDVRFGLGLSDVERPTSPLMFLFLRFTIATLLVWAVSRPRLRELTRPQWGAGIAIGLALCATFAFQTFGLQRTTASTAGFITGLYVVLTPLLGALALRRLPALTTAIGAALAAVGLVLLSSPTGISLGTGEGLVLACAFTAAIHILLLGRFSGTASVQALATIQLGVVAIVTGVLSVATERVPVPTESGIWAAIVVTAVLASALAFYLQTAAQRFIPPSRTALILTMESPFAALFGYVMLEELLSGRGWAGAALILAGMLVAELLAPAREEL